MKEFIIKKYIGFSKMVLCYDAKEDKYYKFKSKKTGKLYNKYCFLEIRFDPKAYFEPTDIEATID